MTTAQSRLWQLDSSQTSVLVHTRRTDEVPAIVWMGSRLSQPVTDSTLDAICDLPVPMAKLDESIAQTLFPQAATGTDASPALQGHRMGKNFSHQFVCTKVTQRKQSLAISLTDKAAELSITIDLALHQDSGVLSIKTTISNEGTSPFEIDHLVSATIPLPTNYSEVLYLHGRWGLEFQTQRQKICTGKLVLENNRGRTSHEHYPGVVAGVAQFGEQQGDVIAAHLAWSGSHQTTVEKLSDGRATLQSGIALDSGELCLGAGEKFTTPAMHVIAAKGINQASQALHNFARAEILPDWTRQPRPIHANSWEALYFDHDISKLRDLIDAAAELGAERFVLDDGWFPARRSDNAGLGDWIVDTSVYPDGLHPLVEHTRAAGLQFGLWFEPEMVNPDSDLYRAHPEWALHLKPYKTALARNQLALNLAIPAVNEYLFTQISALITEYDIDYIKWDHNRDFVLAGDGTKSQMRQQASACYQLMARLNTTHPKLEIESCASGGARADWGILEHTGRVWTSDSIDAIDRVSIQRGYSIFNPPEIMGAHVGHEVAHLTGRSIDIHTRAIVALQGQLGFEVDATHISSEEASILQHYVMLYKKHRDWISSCHTWRLDNTTKHLCCSGLVSEDKAISLWFAVVTASLTTTVPGKLIPSGLDSKTIYTVRLASSNSDYFNAFSKLVPKWLTQDVSVSGELLMTVGLTLPVMPAQSAMLLEISSVAR